MKLINVSNTTLSLYGARRHRKFDAKQSKRHDYGTAHCVVCDKVFTKYHWSTTLCSEECKRERENARKRGHYKENPAKHAARRRKSYEEKSKDPEWVEKINAKQREYNKKNREKINAKARKYHEENREKINAKDRKYYEKNREKELAKARKYYEENRKDPEWVEKINARQLARYHAKKGK